ELLVRLDARAKHLVGDVLEHERALLHDRVRFRPTSVPATRRLHAIELVGQVALTWIGMVRRDLAEEPVGPDEGKSAPVPQTLDHFVDDAPERLLFVPGDVLEQRRRDLGKDALTALSFL